jgi:quercetin dioxygenase-like cupin family protein
MADVTVRRTEDFEAGARGGFLKARAGLGVSSFGMQILRFPPHADGHPEHDHSANGEEEVYTVLEGEITLRAGGEEYALEPGTFARVGPDETRKLVTGESGAVVLALGGIPGQPFEIAGFTEPSDPEPNGAG